MLTDQTGLRYGYNVTDFNKTNPENKYAKLTDVSRETNLEDYQTVNNVENDNKYHKDGRLMKDVKEEERKELQNDLLGVKADKASLGIDKGHSHKLGSPKSKDGFDKDCPQCECETCKNRRYQDGSDDSAVSFQQPTKMRPEEARWRVKSHEMEHVRHEQVKAKNSDRKVVSQSVQILTASCFECGEIYVKGGLTRTQTKYDNDEYFDLFRVGAEDFTKKGLLMDDTA